MLELGTLGVYQHTCIQQMKGPCEYVSLSRRDCSSLREIVSSGFRFRFTTLAVLVILKSMIEVSGEIYKGVCMDGWMDVGR